MRYNKFYCSILNNRTGHKFYNLETSSPIHTWINTTWTYIILYTYFILSKDMKKLGKHERNFCFSSGYKTFTLKWSFTRKELGTLQKTATANVHGHTCKIMTWKLTIEGTPFRHIGTCWGGLQAKPCQYICHQYPFI